MIPPLRRMVAAAVFLAITVLMLSPALPDEDRAAAALNAAAAAERQGEFGEALERLEAAISLYGAEADPERIGRLHHGRAGLLLALGDNAGAEEAARLSLALLDEARSSTLPIALSIARVGEALRRQGDFKDAAQFFDAFHTLSRDDVLDPRVQWAERNAALNSAWLGDHQAAARRLAELATRVVPDYAPRIAVDRLDVALMARNRENAAARLDELYDMPGILDAFPATLPYLRARFLNLSHDYGEADRLLDQLIAEIDANRIEPPPRLLPGILNLSGQYKLGRGLSDEARGLFLGATAALAESGVTEGLEVANVATGLAAAEIRSGQLTAAAQRLREALTAATSSLGDKNIMTVPIRVELAHVLAEQGDDLSADAEREYIRAILAAQTYETGRARYVALQARIVDARISMLRGENADALARLERVILEVEAIEGHRSHLLPTPLTWQSTLLSDAAQYDAAANSARRALEIRLSYDAIGPSRLTETYYRLAIAEEGRGRIRAARAALDAATRILEDYSGGLMDSAAPLEIEREIQLQRKVLEMAVRLGHEGSSSAPSELFGRAIQLANLTSTEAAMLRITRALAEENSRRGWLLRQREDLQTDLRAIMNADPDDDAELGLRLAEKLRALDVLDAEITALFPEVDLIGETTTLTTDAIQALLAPDEALLLALPAEDALYTLLVSKHTVLSARSAIDESALRSRIEGIRASVNPQDQQFRIDAIQTKGAALHAMYRDLFEPYEGLLADVEHLVFVPSGPLQSLPPGLLLREPVTELTRPSLKDAPWLIRSFSISVLPSARVFSAARTRVIGSRGTDYLGVGDPVLEDDGLGAVRDASDESRGLRRLASSLKSLPETQDELRAVADVSDATSLVLIGENATETRVKSMDLTRFGTLHFATHGLMASETRLFAAGTWDPALVLTPPDVLSSCDDGLFSAAEIAKLRLRGPLVVLSACNTASPSGRATGDGFSGLTKAFLSAGADSLVISHWAVLSKPSAELIVSLFEQLETNESRAVADALRAAMLDMIAREPDSDIPLPAHPAVWAPFVTVGGSASD